MRQKYRYLTDEPAIDVIDNGGGELPAPPTPAPTPAEPTVLDARPDADGFAIPAKYQVKNEDGSLNMDATSKKLAEGYAHLEKRVGSGDLPPKSADEYQIAVPEALKEFLDPANDALMSEFKADALKHGMTQEQMDFVMGKYFDLVPQLITGNNELSAERCTADLRAEWKTDEQFKAEVGKAYRAAMAYGGSDADSIIKDYGNDPRIVRFMAKVGGELGEDAPLGNYSAQSGGSVESLMQSEAYRDAKHPEHKSVSLKVQQHFEHLAAEQKAAGNSFLM